ncbi:MAG: hypothetical protein ACTSRH_17670 [Promethearchaeota archaeon]
MDKQSYEQLIELAREQELKKSQLIKRAIHEWMVFKREVLEENLIVIGKPLFRKLLDSINDEIISKLANFSAKNLELLLKFKIIEHDEKINLERFLESLMKAFGPSGYSWFTKIDYQVIDNNKIIIYGSHSINERFSLYIKILLKNIMKNLFKYEIDEENSSFSHNNIDFLFRPNSS